MIIKEPTKKATIKRTSVPSGMKIDTALKKLLSAHFTEAHIKKADITNLGHYQDVHTIGSKTTEGYFKTVKTKREYVHQWDCRN